jgi:membrane-associated PAP2 superfamily phosphatase
MTIEFLDGLSAMSCAVIALFFYGYWRRTHDRLFGIFALAFFVFGVNRVLLSALDENADGRVYVYLVRLAAFVLILVAIADKNRAPS